MIVEIGLTKFHIILYLKSAQAFETAERHPFFGHKVRTILSTFLGQHILYFSNLVQLGFVGYVWCGKRKRIESAASFCYEHE